MPAKKTDDTALTTTDPEDLIPAPASFSTTPDFGVDDISYPRLKLLQGISPEVMDPESDLKAGQFYISGDAAARKDVTVVIVAYNLSRRYEIPLNDGSGNKDISCQSQDGKIGVGDPGGTCALCPLSKWQTDPTNGRRTLPCQPTYQYVAYVPDFGAVALNLTRTASNAAHMLNGMLQQRGFGNFAVKIAATQVEGGGKRYFVPSIKLVKVEDGILQDAQSLMP